MPPATTTISIVFRLARHPTVCRGSLDDASPKGHSLVQVPDGVLGMTQLTETHKDKSVASRVLNLYVLNRPVLRADLFKFTLGNIMGQPSNPDTGSCEVNVLTQHSLVADTPR